MMKRACLVFVLAATGCLDAEYDDVRIDGPSLVQTEPGALLELHAFGERAGETSVDLTSSLKWLSMNVDVADVTDNGTVLVLDSGFTHICAILDGELRATVMLSSKAPDRSTPDIDVSGVAE